MTIRHVLVVLPLLGLLACEDRGRPVLAPLPDLSTDAGSASSRIDGSAGGSTPRETAQVSLAPATNITVRQPASAGGAGGDISLNFADTDIRDVVAQILGAQLGENYTIDPTVRGTATLRTTKPVGLHDLLPILQTLLAQNGASLVQSGGLYRVVPTAAAAGAPDWLGAPAVAAAASSSPSVMRPRMIWRIRWRPTCKMADASWPTPRTTR